MNDYLTYETVDVFPDDEPESKRTDNILGGRAHCEYCCNDGLVVTALRTDAIMGYIKQEGGARKWGEVGRTGPIEEYGPCPACRLGERVEFGTPDRPGGPWGRDGYWRGRPWEPELEPSCVCFKPAGKKALDEARAAGLIPDLGNLFGYP